MQSRLGDGAEILYFKLSGGAVMLSQGPHFEKKGKVQHLEQRFLTRGHAELLNSEGLKKCTSSVLLASN